MKIVKKALIAALVGATALMTACSGGGTAASSEAAESVAESAPESEGMDAAAGTTEDVSVPDAEEVTAEETSETAFTMPQVETEFTNGVLTLRLDGGTEKEGFEWCYDREDRGDARLVQLLTESSDDGCQYAGSYRAIPDGGDGDDHIRLIYTNYTYVYAYFDAAVTVKDNEIVSCDVTEIEPLDDGKIAGLIEGTWQQENDGALFLDIARNDADGFEAVISDGSGKDGTTVFTTMTVHYDVLKNALIYVDGAEQSAEITDGTGGESSVSEGEAGAGNGEFLMEYDENGESVLCLEWQDKTGGQDPVRFVKA